MHCKQNIWIESLTAMYGLQPASLVFAMESTKWPLMPKSQSLILPSMSSNILDGFTSENLQMKTLFHQDKFIIYITLKHTQNIVGTKSRIV